MVNQKRLFAQLPLLTKEDIKGYSALPIPEDELQLQVDTINVLEKRVEIETFPKEYQEKIKNYYRFSATRMYTQNSVIAKRTNDTLDIV